MVGYLVNVELATAWTELVLVYYEGNGNLFLLWYTELYAGNLHVSLRELYAGSVHVWPRELPYILESNPHLVFADFLNEKKVSSCF